MGGLKIAVYDLKQAERVLGKFNKDVSVVVDTKKVYIAYAENHNERFKQTGSYYEINEKKNDAFIEAAKKKNPSLFEDKPVSKMNVEELKVYLSEHDIEILPEDKKADLLEKANGIEK